MSTLFCLKHQVTSCGHGVNKAVTFWNKKVHHTNKCNLCVIVPNGRGSMFRQIKQNKCTVWTAFVWWIRKGSYDSVAQTNEYDGQSCIQDSCFDCLWLEVKDSCFVFRNVGKNTSATDSSKIVCVCVNIEHVSLVLFRLSQICLYIVICIVRT